MGFTGFMDGDNWPASVRRLVRPGYYIVLTAVPLAWLLATLAERSERCEALPHLCVSMQDAAPVILMVLLVGACTAVTLDKAFGFFPEGSLVLASLFGLPAFAILLLLGLLQTTGRLVMSLIDRLHRWLHSREQDPGPSKR